MTPDLRFLLKTKYADSHALLIGINDYTVASPLSYAVSDAEGVRDALIDELDFPAENVTILKDDGATRANILRAYMGFSASRVNIDDRILVFFAGHGHTVTGSRGEVGYLVPVDGDRNDLSTLIRWDELTRNAELIRAKHMLFIMDACYGGLMVTRQLDAGSARFLKDMLLRRSRQVLTAGKADEVVADSGGPVPNHSIFTGHLLEGLRGKAHTEDGILTANALMAYVYGKVAKDQNSHQTPHYGYFDGDGDFIFDAPQLGKLQESEGEDLDTLIVIPFSNEGPPIDSTQQKLKKIKALLGSDDSAIELHDFVVSEVRRFLAGTDETNFKLQGPFSKEILLERIAKYEEHANDLSLIAACLSQWGKSSHQSVLQRLFSRSTDLMDVQSGKSVWLSLRWYPIIIELYCAGIAAVASGRFDALATIFTAPVGAATYDHKNGLLVTSVAEGILELNRAEVFKQLPGHALHFTPMSEYLFKILQPQLDALLFLGKGYESAYDDFELLFALTVADLRLKKGLSGWAPFGRFGWKGRHDGQSPLHRLMVDASTAGGRWEPVVAGLFGGNIERFNEVAKGFAELIGKLNWY